MSLSIRTNVASLTAQRNLYSTQSSLDSSLSKLSSGFRITKAGDDAAGLGISTKLESQIRSYTQATRNANDGISVVQATESALNEQANILTRLRELAMQSGSDGVGNSERAYIQKESTALVAELQRISQTAEYNGTKLLDGSAATLDFQVGIAATANDVISLNTLNATTAASVGGTPAVPGVLPTPAVRPDAWTIMGVAHSAYNASRAGGKTPLFAELDATIAVGALPGWTEPGQFFSAAGSAASSARNAELVGGALLVTATANGGSGGDPALANAITLYAADIVTSQNRTTAIAAAGGGSAGQYADQIFLMNYLFNQGTLSGGSNQLVSGPALAAAVAAGWSGTPTVAGSAAIPGTPGSPAVPGTAGGLDVQGLSLASKSGALAALASIDSALATISSNRATLGAAGNRFQSAISNIQAFSESLSAANSRIKDVDVAEETSRMSRSQILMQAGVSVLAQANQMPQMALKLLG